MFIGLFGGSLLIFFAAKFIQGADYEKDDKGDDKKINDILEKITVGDNGGIFGAKKVGNGEFKRSKIKATSNKGDDRHNDIVD